jgi:hypothetical protein
MTGPRDWDRELAKIDKAIERLPAGAPPAGGVPPAAGGSAAPARTAGAGLPAPSRRETMTTWLRVVLVLALAAAMPFWPYPHACGSGLWLYVASASVVVLAGLWGAVSSWARRRPVAHVLSLLTVLWGLGLVAAEVLPRAGYAAKAATWTCS